MTEFFTIFEQKEIKIWSKKAKERNKKGQDGTFWRFREYSSRELYLKKVENMQKGLSSLLFPLLLKKNTKIIDNKGGRSNTM